MPSQNIFQFSDKDEILDMIATELEEFYNLPHIEYTRDGKWIYILYKSHLKIYTKKLHLTVLCGRVVDYRIHYFFLGICIA